MHSNSGYGRVRRSREGDGGWDAHKYHSLDGLNQIATSRNISADDPEIGVYATPVVEDPAAEDDGEASPAVSYFFDCAHDEFMTKLHKDFVSRYGVDIANIRMESFKIMDAELSSEISQNCLTTAHVGNELAS